MPTAETSLLVDKSVLIVGNFLSRTPGAHNVCEELAEQLQDSGWAVTTTSNKVRRLVRVADMMRTAWSARKAYAVALVDVFSGPAFMWAEAACWTLRRARRPYILTLRGGALPEFANKWPRRVRRLLHSAAAVTTPSAFLLEHMAAYADGIRLLPNPLDLRRYPHRQRDYVEPAFMWMRAFHAIYNPVMAPAVLAKIRQEMPSARLTMVGPDKGDGTLQKVEDAARVLGVADGLHLPGGVPKREVPSWISTGDIFLNTTDVDNTPVSVLEAMACGLCVVSTDVGGIRYLLRHEHDALLVPPRDPDAMAHAVRRLMQEPMLAARLSHHARRKVERMDWSIVLPQWEELMAEAAQRA